MLRRASRRTVLLLTCITLVTIASSGVAFAVISPTSTAKSIATAISRDSTLVTGASFASVPESGSPNAYSSTELAGFGTHGSLYGVLTTGDARLAEQPNKEESSGSDNGGSNVRGDSDYDVTVLKIDLKVPQDTNCLSIDFRFLSEEYPEYVASGVNDAFVAELDDSNWSTSEGVVSAPNNFAFDQNGNPISIDSTGTTSVSAAEASGTTYDGATQILQAKKAVTPGSHSVYLSIFDQGDDSYDSAVFVDDLTVGKTADGACVGGAKPEGEGEFLTTTPFGGFEKVTPAGSGDKYSYAVYSRKYTKEMAKRFEFTDPNTVRIGDETFAFDEGKEVSNTICNPMKAISTLIDASPSFSSGVSDKAKKRLALFKKLITCKVVTHTIASALEGADYVSWFRSVENAAADDDCFVLVKDKKTNKVVWKASHSLSRANEHGLVYPTNVKPRAIPVLSDATHLRSLLKCYDG